MDAAAEAKHRGRGTEMAAGKIPLAPAGAAVYDKSPGRGCAGRSGSVNEIPMRNPDTAEDRLTERDLIHRVAARDREAFETLYRRYAPRVFRYLSSQIRQREIVEETLDDVMMVVWETAGRYNGTSQLSTWILGIAHYKALKGRARVSTSDAEFQESDHGGIETHSPETIIAERELTDKIRQAMDALSAEQRAVVELTFYHGRSYAEIAEILDCPVNTVKTRMFHARQRLEGVLNRQTPLV
jgi:RNA polymerase sigma-70 factor (ECF subfamily)